MQAITPSAAVASPLLQNRLLIKPKHTRLVPVSAKKNTNGSDFGGGFGLVDENMIELRKRMHQMEVAERNNEAPSHWMEWEKRYYTTYGSDVCGFVGLVQMLLLKTQPGFAIGLLGLIGMSVPTSVVLIWIQLLEAMRLGHI